MKYITKTMLAIFVAPVIFAKSITFNLASGSCQLDQVGASSFYSEGVTYSPNPPLHVGENSSASFRVNIVPSKIPYNTNSELLSGFSLYYKVDCPQTKQTGYLRISGDYYGWKYFSYLNDNSTGHVSNIYTGSGYYNNQVATIKFR